MASTSKNYIRNLEDVRKIIHHAKLSEDTLLPVTQSIYFCDEFKEYKLLELDNELLSKLKNGVELKVRGNKEDKAVLCSDTKTYEIKEAETSNSLLLIPELKFPNEVKFHDAPDRTIELKDVIGVFHTYYEVIPCKPKFTKLRSILEESSYRGSELESELIDSGVKMYTTDELLPMVQASELELENALKELFAFQLNGKWRVLEHDYHLRTLSQFLRLIDEQSWPCDKIPVSDVFELLEKIIPSYILQYLMSVYTEESLSESERFVKLIESRVCRLIGVGLLKETTMELSEFLKIWQDMLLEGLKADLHHLDGLIYIGGELNEKIIHYCPDYELPADVAERIKHLFTLKKKWSFDEIKPFLRAFTTEKINENAILTKYARTSNCNGVRLYSSRHGK